MPKPISVILHNRKIIGSFTCRDEAIAEFKKMEIADGEISLHILDRPDRRKKATRVVKEQPVAEKPAARKAPDKTL